MGRSFTNQARDQAPCQQRFSNDAMFETIAERSDKIRIHGDEMKGYGSRKIIPGGRDKQMYSTRLLGTLTDKCAAFLGNSVDNCTIFLLPLKS